MSSVCFKLPGLERVACCQGSWKSSTYDSSMRSGDKTQSCCNQNTTCVAGGFLYSLSGCGKHRRDGRVNKTTTPFTPPKPSRDLPSARVGWFRLNSQGQSHQRCPHQWEHCKAPRNSTTRCRCHCVLSLRVCIWLSCFFICFIMAISCRDNCDCRKVAELQNTRKPMFAAMVKR